MRYAKLLVLLLGAVLVVGCVQLGDKDKNEDKKTITTTGNAQIKVQPDIAIVYVTVETNGKTSSASTGNNSNIVDKVYAALYKLNVPRENIATEYFNTNEDFDWTDGGRKSLGFKTSHALRIKTEKFTDIGNIIDAAVGAGATRIDNVNFDLSDAKKKELKKKALSDASKDAREKAEAIASGAGATLGDIVSISDATYDYEPYPIFRNVMAADEAVSAAKTEISPQTLDVTASVQVVYEMG